MFYHYSHSERVHSNTLAFNKSNVLFSLFFFPWPFPISFLVLATNANHELYFTYNRTDSGDRSLNTQTEMTNCI